MRGHELTVRALVTAERALQQLGFVAGQVCRS
jgi:hypothetical protein